MEYHLQTGSSLTRVKLFQAGAGGRAKPTVYAHLFTRRINHSIQKIEHAPEVWNPRRSAEDCGSDANCSCRKRSHWRKSEHGNPGFCKDI
ncbi:hypothetical protein SRHO_G00330690 [Serrasalmus rhombeus]